MEITIKINGQALPVEASIEVYNEEPNPLTGVLYCADCGEKMYHKRGNTGKPNQPHHEYVCSSYRHYSRSCTCHYIRVAVSGLIKKLYEAYAAGKIPEKHFTELLTGYDTEQETLDTEIAKLQTAIDTYNTDSVRADKFMELVKRHTEFKEFSATFLNEFIEKVIVHEAVKVNGKREQVVDIYLNFIGKFEIPLTEEAPIRTSKKKLRQEMTEEQVQRERERDKKRYAQKVAAKKAARTRAQARATAQV